MRLKTLFVLLISSIIISCGGLPEEYQKLEELNVFKISEDKNSIVLDGVINSSAFKDFKDLATQHPNIKNLKIINCEGSINDDVNLQLAKYVHQQKFNTHLNENGSIASGGTDLFLAGIKRSLGKNISIGVHSWGDGKDIQATDFPKGHKHHKPYIDYYQSIGFSLKEAEDFYYFTINSASANDVHWMTVDEIKKYKMINTNNPIVVYKDTEFKASNNIPESIVTTIIGNWKLQNLHMGREIIAPKNVMGTNEVYQNYQINNKFTSNVGKKSENGTWKYSKELKAIVLDISKEITELKIADFKDNKMSLIYNDNGQKFLLNYKKVN